MSNSWQRRRLHLQPVDLLRSGEVWPAVQGSVDVRATSSSAPGSIVPLVRWLGSRWAQLLRLHASSPVHAEGLGLLQHAWQCARLAARTGESPALELAAWLHDLDHVLMVEGMCDSLEQASQMAAAFLQEVWGPDVAEPVRLLPAARACWASTGLSEHVTLTPTLLDRMHAATAELWPRDSSARPHCDQALRLCRLERQASDINLFPPDLDTAVARMRAVSQQLAPQPADLAETPSKTERSAPRRFAANTATEPTNAPAANRPPPRSRSRASIKPLLPPGARC